jgi:hypothetical protein
MVYRMPENETRSRTDSRRVRDRDRAVSVKSLCGGRRFRFEVVE